jgi:hypothetical protein
MELNQTSSRSLDKTERFKDIIVYTCHTRKILAHITALHHTSGNILSAPYCTRLRRYRQKDPCTYTSQLSTTRIHKWEYSIISSVYICTLKNLYVGIDRDSCSFISLDLYKTTSTIHGWNWIKRPLDPASYWMASIHFPIIIDCHYWCPNIIFHMSSSGQSSHHTRILSFRHHWCIQLRSCVLLHPAVNKLATKNK